MKKPISYLLVAFLAGFACSEPIEVLVWAKTKKSSKYKKGIEEVIADGLNETNGLTATAVRDDQSKLTTENLSNYDALFFVHAMNTSSASDKGIVSLVEAGKLGLVTSHDALRGHDEVRELVGMTKMYTDYMDMQKIWSVSPGHPITAGVPDTFVLDPGQPYVTFTVNSDVDMIFEGESTKDKDLKVGWTRTPGAGRTFNFCPDHETYTNYENPNVKKIFSNAAFWVTAKETALILTEPENKRQGLSHSLNDVYWNIHFPVRRKNVAAESAVLYNVMGKTVGTVTLPQ